MNLFKKIYCRTFQLGFKLIYPFLPYKEPKILNSIDDLPDVFNELKINRVLLITDKGIRGFGITKHLEELLWQVKVLVMQIINHHYTLRQQKKC